MWGLLTGSTYSTNDEENDGSNGARQPSYTGATAMGSAFDRPPGDKKLVDVVRRRLPSPTREEGDGMESATERSVAREKSAGGSKSVIVLPQTNVRVDKLPPITADREVNLPTPKLTSTLVQMTVVPRKGIGVLNAATGGAEAISLARKFAKEPKFVPYEPYKAAVNSLVPGSSKSSRWKRCASASSSSTAASRISKDVDVDRNRCQEDQAVNVRLQNELEKAHKKLAEAEKQLKIQLQVNAEVKKLLVASVGEDIEAKVEYLTQDKVRLAADIRNYSHAISRDFEEKEKLSVESDLWKSKFLACSVIVDELARWKASLLQKCDGFDHQVRLLFHERAVLWDTLNENLNVVNHLKHAFDPLATMHQVDADPVACSVLGLAEESLKASKCVRHRLLGRDKRNEADAKVGSAGQREKIDTPAEEGLRGVIASQLESPSCGEDCSAQASAAITGAARPYLAKMSDKLASPRVTSSQFKCCGHCNGPVQVV